MVSGATNFIETSRNDIINTVNFPYFMYSCNMSYKINKTNMLATKLIYTGSFTRVMDFKFLLVPRNILNMIQKNYHELLLQNSLFTN